MEDIKSEVHEKSPSLCCSSDTDNIFGEPIVRPRIGCQYQVEIPELIMGCVHEKDDETAMDDRILMYLLSKPFPLKHDYSLGESIKEGSVHNVHRRDASLDINRSSESGNINELWRSPSTGIKDGPSHEHTMESGRYFEGGNCLSIKGSMDFHLGDVERGSFLLSLYIFGKNLHLVQRFVSSVGMGNILLFYYGKFYRSCEYKRWSECGKTRRKGTYGKRIFKGWRLQELLSRLASKVAKECLDTLLLISRALTERKLTVKEYVFALRDEVGVELFVEAVGIGKGKQDLTDPDLEQPPKGSHTFLISPEIPVGRACSSLTSADIIRFLTGDFRLSKARSNDLFWEAVWPRLLALGWHSEQLKGHGLTISNHPIIFLVPGVKRFSRRRLVKGSHYFNSVSDILNEIALNPGLLETDTGRPAALSGFINGFSPETSGGSGSASDSSLCSTETESGGLKLTMVDTSSTQPDRWRHPLLLPAANSGSSEGCRNLRKKSETSLTEATADSKSVKEGKRNHRFMRKDLGKKEGGILFRKKKRNQSMDLNIPSIPLDFRIRGDSSALGLLHYCVGTERCLAKMEEQSEGGGGGNGGGQQQIGKTRQSTRNRPLTKKALEALESGFWAVERKKRRKKNTGVEPLP